MRDRLPIFCFVILFQTSFSALNTMLLPFLRSGVQCNVHRLELGSKISTLTPPDTRAPAEPPKKRTKRQQPGRALDASPRSRADWTGSTMCDDKDTVLATSQRADGWCTSLRVLVHMASTPLLGALADRHGRVRIVVLSVGLVTACALAFALTAAAASRHAADWAESSDTTDASGGVLRLPLWTLLCGYVLLGCSAVQPPLNAALTDRTPPEERGAAFSVLGVCHALAGGAGTLLSIFLLRLDLEEYGSFWVLIALAVPVLALPLALLGPPSAQGAAERETTAFLQETEGGLEPEELLPYQPPSPTPAQRGAVDADEQGAASRELGQRPGGGAAAAAPAATGVRWAAAELMQAAAGLCGLLRASLLLRRLSVGIFLLMWGVAGGLSILNNFTLAVYDWQQGDLQVLWMASLPSALFGLGLANCFLFKRYGAPVVYCMALSALCLGFVLLVLAPFSPAALTGFLLLCGFATVGFAAILTILAQRFEPCEQARAQALLVFSSTLSRSTAAPAFAHIFDPRDRGVEAARPFVLALIFVLAGSCVLGTSVLQGQSGGVQREASLADSGYRAVTGS